MDKRNGPICNPVWRALSGVSELTPWGQLSDPQPSQRLLLHKTSDIPHIGESRYRQLEVLGNFIRNDQPAHLPCSCQILLHPPHVAKQLSHGAVITLRHFQFDHYEVASRVCGENINEPSAYGVFDTPYL